MDSTFTTIIYTVITYAPIVAFFLVQLSGIDSIYQIFVHRNTDNVNPVPFLVMIFNCILWVFYGILEDDLTVLISNAAGVFFGSVYLFIFCIFTPWRKSKWYILALLVLILMSVLCFQFPTWIDDPRHQSKYIGFMGCTTAALLLSSPLTEMKRVIKDKSTRSMSFPMSLAMWFNAVTWVLYGAIIDNWNPFLVIHNGVGVVAGCVQLALFCVYREGTDPKWTAVTATSEDLDVAV